MQVVTADIGQHRGYFYEALTGTPSNKGTPASSAHLEDAVLCDINDRRLALVLASVLEDLQGRQLRAWHWVPSAGVRNVFPGHLRGAMCGGGSQELQLKAAGVMHCASGERNFSLLKQLQVCLCSGSLFEEAAGMHNRQQQAATGHSCWQRVLWRPAVL